MTDNNKFNRKSEKIFNTAMTKAIDNRADDVVMVMGTHFFSISTKSLTFLKKMGLYHDFLSTLSDKDKKIIELTISMEENGLTEYFNKKLENNKVETYLSKKQPNNKSQRLK